MVESVRRSGRARQPSKKYSVDAFEIQGLHDLLSSEDDDESAEPGEDDDSGEDRDFDEAELESEEGEADNASSGDAQSSDIQTVDDEEVGSIAGSDVATPVRTSKPARRGKVASSSTAGPVRSLQQSVRPRKAERGMNWNTRGIREHINKTAQGDRLFYTYGTDRQDILHSIQAKNRWGYIPTLPWYKQDKEGHGGFVLSPFYSDAIQTAERARGWQWYLDNGGKQAFVQRQVNLFLTTEQAVPYVYRDFPNESKLLYGPHKHQNLHALGHGESISAGEAWLNNLVEGDVAPKQNLKQKKGFVFNVACRVHCMAWIPHMKGVHQYLSLTHLHKTEQEEKKEKKPKALPYTATGPFPSSIEIWHIQATAMPTDDEPAGLPDNAQLKYVLCTDWGDIKQFEWCPVPYPDTEGWTDDDQIKLGLLAGIWSDGGVRVLDVNVPRSRNNETVYVHIKSSAFEAIPPNTVATGLTWLSSSSLAASCANGCVVVWSIADHLKHCSLNPSASSNARPWFYQALHETFIFSITSGYPSRPHLVVTSSMDGFYRLTDLRAPKQDFVFGHRSRYGAAPLEWHDATQCFLATDENYSLQGYPMRRFFTTMLLGRVEGNISSIAVSPVHTSVLMASVDGKVNVTNVLRRVMFGKSHIWQQPWFRHDWRRGLSDDEINPSNDTRSQTDVGPDANGDMPMANAHEPPTEQPEAHAAPTVDPIHLRQPLSRITEGYQAQKRVFGSGGNGMANQYNGVLYSTIYDRETAVTQVCWNPNMHCGGWAAASTGSGLIRVEDLSI